MNMILKYLGDGSEKNGSISQMSQPTNIG